MPSRTDLKLYRRGASGNWYIRGTVRGIRVYESTKLSERRDAQEVLMLRAREILETAVHGQRATASFAKASASYLEYAERSPSTHGHVKRLIEHFGTKRLADIGQAELDGAYKALCRPDAKPATKLRNVLVPLRAVMEHAAHRKWCARPDFQEPEVKDADTDFMLPGQATALVRAAAPHLRPLLVFLIGTGCRMSEALDLEWSRVDMRGARATVRQKQGNQRKVDLPPVVVTALASIHRESGHVFRPPPQTKNGIRKQPDRYLDTGRLAGGQIKTGWAAACRRAGMEGEYRTWTPPRGGKPQTLFTPKITPHGMRHTWASWHYCINKDVLRLVRDGGWSSQDMVDRYAHLIPEAYRAECEEWLLGGAKDVQVAV